MSDLRKTLKEMAQLTVFSNRISEQQEKNLKMWPFVYFENVMTVNVDYDLGHGVNDEKKEINHNSKVSYHLLMSDGYEEANKEQLDKRFLAIETSVRQLFWKDVRVQVFFNRKLAYESKT